MSKGLKSALSGLVAAILTVLVTAGVLGGADADSIQTVVVAVITFIGTVAIHSAHPAV